MPVDLEELKAEHERVKARHARYKKLDAATTALFCLALLALGLAWAFFADAPACTGAACGAARAIGMVLALSCAVVFALATRHQTRGIGAYRRAIALLRASGRA
jgi:hypothetical protein